MTKGSGAMTKGSGAMTKIKICGLSRPDDIRAANRIRPDYIGFVTYPKSRRFVTKEQAARLKALLDPGIPAVAVTVNMPAEDAAAYITDHAADILQLHGAEDASYIRRLRALVPAGTTVIKAFTIRGAADLAAARGSSADYVILDNGLGTGQRFDWNLLLTDFDRPYFLAGGLDPDNIGDAVMRFHPYAVDLSSGVETGGMKDYAKMEACVKAVRTASGV